MNLCYSIVLIIRLCLFAIYFFMGLTGLTGCGINLLVSQKRFLNLIKRQIWARFPKRGGEKRTLSPDEGFWARQLRLVEMLGPGLVVMRMSK